MPEVTYNIKWDEAAKKTYETGVDRGVLYPYNAAATDGSTPYDAGYAWNGLTAFNKSPSGAEPTALWANNVKWMTLMSAEEFGATIEAYVYPTSLLLAWVMQVMRMLLVCPSVSRTAPSLVCVSVP